MSLGRSERTKRTPTFWGNSSSSTVLGKPINGSPNPCCLDVGEPEAFRAAERKHRQSLLQPAVPLLARHESGELHPLEPLRTDARTQPLQVQTTTNRHKTCIRHGGASATGGGRIHVYYLRNANAEELAQTLGGLVGGVSAPSAPPGGAPGQPGVAPAIRSAVTGLIGDISITADPATNSLIIQASQEGFNTLSQVIEKLDVERPQVLVEALIMEVDVSDGTELGFNGLLRTINGDTNFMVASATGAAEPPPTSALEAASLRPYPWPR